MSWRNPSTKEELEKRRAYHREWERRAYAIKPRVRVFTPEQKARAHERYLKQKDQQIAAINLRRKENPLQRKKWDQKHYATHKQHYLDKGRRWAKGNRPKRLIIEKRYRAKNPDKTKAVWQKRIANGKLAESMHRRRARIINTASANCAKIVSLLRHMPLCQYCFGLLDSPTIDHVIPLTRGGTHTKGNLVAACQPCNSSKGTKFLSEWSGRVLEEAA